MATSKAPMELCPDCEKGEMRIERSSVAIEGKEEPYIGYEFICTECGEKTFICLINEADAIDVWNRVSNSIREANALEGSAGK